MAESQETQDKVKDIIERARRDQSKELSLSYMYPDRLDNIPDEVFDLTHIETLDLFGNNIREVPERIRELINLRHLDIRQNPIEKLPDIPGVSLDWTSYLRCRKTLSRQNVQGIWIDIDEEQFSKTEQSEGSELSQELALLPNLRTLILFLSISRDSKIPHPPKISATSSTISANFTFSKHYPSGANYLKRFPSEFAP